MLKCKNLFYRIVNILFIFIFFISNISINIKADELEENNEKPAFTEEDLSVNESYTEFTDTEYNHQDENVVNEEIADKNTENSNIIIDDVQFQDETIIENDNGEVINNENDNSDSDFANAAETNISDKSNENDEKFTDSNEGEINTILDNISTSSSAINTEPVEKSIVTFSNSRTSDFIKKVWNFSEYTGDRIVYNYDGLEIIQAPEKSNTKVVVESSNKKYESENKIFTQCLKTAGDAKVSNSYVPETRAIKLTIDRPYMLNLYMTAGSTTAENPTAIISRKGKIIGKRRLNNSVIKYSVLLDRPDTYYIYSEKGSGSTNIYELELSSFIKGDIDGDGWITDYDAAILEQYLVGDITLNDNQLELANLDENKIVDDDDAELLDEMLVEYYGYFPYFLNAGEYIGDFDTEGRDPYCYIKEVTDKNYEKTLPIDIVKNNYNEKKWEYCAQVKGSTANIDYVPKSNAFKFYVNGDYMVNLYISSNCNEVSDNDNEKMYISRKGELIYEGNITSEIKKYTINLNSPDIYYIYLPEGNNGINLYYLEVKGKINGDINCNGYLDYYDMTLLQSYINGKIDLEKIQIDKADVNSDGLINEDDYYELLKLIKNQSYGNEQYAVSDKVWNISDFIEGNLYVYDNLAALQVSDDNKNKVCVAESIKNIYDKNFTKCIKTGGGTNNKNYVPKDRAIKFITDKPCKMTLYVSNGSKTAEKPTALITRSGELIKEIPLKNGIEKVEVNLMIPDIYYIYSSANSGSINIYYIELNSLKGDINSDRKINDEDINMLYNYLNKNEKWGKELEERADVNNDGIINYDDLNYILKILNKTEIKDERVSNKIWNASEMPIGSINYYDGLTLYQSSNDEDKIKIRENNKNFEKLNFKNSIFIPSKAKLNGIAPDNKIPLNKALRFKTSKPCFLVLYISGEGKVQMNTPNDIIDKISLTSEKPIKKVIYLSETKEYFLYSIEGSMDIYYLKLTEASGVTKGDLNLDGNLTLEDSLLLKDLTKSDKIEKWEKVIGDMNGDNSITEEDYIILSTKISECTEEEIDYICDFLQIKESDIKLKKILYDVDNNPNYLLVTFNSGGYLILIRKSFDVIEYALEGTSPYSKYENYNLYYLGLLNYYYEKEDNLFNINTNELISDEFKNTARKLNDRYINLGSRNKNIIDLASAESRNKKVRISNAEIIRKAGFPHNDRGICGPIAASILLQYYDKTKNENFISAEYEPIPHLDTKFSPYFIENFALWQERNKTDLPNEVGTGGSHLQDDCNAINYWLGSDPERAKMCYTAYDSSLEGFPIGYDYRKDIKKLIDNDMPTNISISGDPNYNNHTIVTVGYQSDSSDSISFAEVHAGLHASCKDSSYGDNFVNINAEYIDSGCIWIDKVKQHEHNYVEEIYDIPGKDYENYHYLRCSYEKCNLINRFPHKFKIIDNGKNHTLKCDVCGYSKECSGKIVYQKVDSNYHKKICNVCGSDIAIKETHTLTYASINNSEHEVQCKYCNYKANVSHTFGSYNKSNLQHYRVCSKCNKSVYEEHKYGNWIKSSNSQHIRTCSKCGNAQYANHSFSAWGNNGTLHLRSCSCGATETSIHTYGGWTNSGINHVKKCTVCGNTQSGNHTYGGWTNSGINHVKKCTVCGNTQSGNHTYGGWTNSGINHVKKCTVCGNTQSESHMYGGWTNSGYNHEKSCTICGNTQSGSHTYGSWNNLGTKHYRSCTMCTSQETKDHNYGSWTRDSFSHSRVCKDCNSSDYGSHSYNGWKNNGSSGHSKECTICGYTSSGGHHIQYGMSMNVGNFLTCQTKSGFCTECYYYSTVNTSHNFSFNGKCSTCCYNRGY